MERKRVSDGISVKQCLWGILALGLSIGVHSALLQTLPNVPVGLVPDYSPREKHESSRLDRVELESPESVERPDAFRPEDPASVQAGVVKEILPPPVDEGWKPDKASAPAPSPDTYQAVAEAAPLPLREDWLPRQEVVEIEERRFDDSEVMLPRKITPEVDREVAAPDFTPPVDVASLGDAPLVHPTPASLFEQVGQGTAASTAVGLDGGLDMLPDMEMDSDEWMEESEVILDEAPEDISASDAVEDILALQLTSAKVSDDPYTYFELQILRNGPEGLPVLPKDVLIIQDASKSMTQRKLENCKAGILNVLDELNPDDRFNIIAFRDELIWAYEDWQAYEGPMKAKTRLFLEDLKASGKTDVSGSLESIVGLRSDPGRAVLAILVTDGRPTMGLVDSSDIIVRVSEANEGDVSVFALGGGARVNRFLLDMLSYHNRGDSMVVPLREEIPDALARWSAQLDRPVLTDLEFRFTGLDEDDIYPKTLTHLFLDRPLRIFGRTKTPEKPIAFRIEGASGEITRDMVFQLTLPSATPGREEQVREDWAWQKAYSMIGDHIRTDSDQLMDDIRAHAKAYSIAIPYASEFIPFHF